MFCLRLISTSKMIYSLFPVRNVTIVNREAASDLKPFHGSAQSEALENGFSTNTQRRG